MAYPKFYFVICFHGTHLICDNWLPTQQPFSLLANSIPISYGQLWAQPQDMNRNGSNPIGKSQSSSQSSWPREGHVTQSWSMKHKETLPRAFWEDFPFYKRKFSEVFNKKGCCCFCFVFFTHLSSYLLKAQSCDAWTCSNLRQQGRQGDKRAGIFYNTVKLQNQHWDLDFVT